MIFTLPPAELGIHPVDHPGAKAGDHAISLMCDDIHATVRDLRARGIQISGEPEDHGYGITVMAALPGDVRIQVYEPRHPLAITPASRSDLRRLRGGSRTARSGSFSRSQCETGDGGPSPSSAGCG